MGQENHASKSDFVAPWLFLEYRHIFLLNQVCLGKSDLLSTPLLKIIGSDAW